MKTIKNINTHSKKYIVITAIALLIVGVATAITIYALTFRNTPTDNSAIETSSDVTKDQVKDTEPTQGQIDKGATDSKNQPSSTPQTSSLALPRILNAYQEGTTIRVSVDFNEVASGSCVLRLYKDNETTIEMTASIIVVPSGYACNGFTTTVPSYGGWQVSIIHINGDQKSIEVTKTVE